MTSVPYSPAESVLKRLRQVHLVLLVGPSGAGKSTLINQLVQKDAKYHFVLTEMSRPPRPEEVNGRDANFHSRETMEAKISERAYVQVAPSVFGDYYATAIESYAPDKICLLPCIAAEVENLRSLPFKELKVVCLLPPSFDEWFKRMGGHKFSPDKLKRRFAEAHTSLEFAQRDADSYYIITDTIERSTQVLESIIAAGNGDPEQQSRQLAASLDARLQA